MSYVEKKLLVAGESVEHFYKKAGVILFFKWLWGILGFWLIFIPTIKAIKYTVEHATTEYAITNRKLIEKYGWLSIHTDEMPFNKIENLTVKQSFWGRIFNYGSISIQGTNRNHIHFTNIKNVHTVKNQIAEIANFH